MAGPGSFANPFVQRRMTKSFGNPLGSPDMDSGLEGGLVGFNPSLPSPAFPNPTRSNPLAAPNAARPPASESERYFNAIQNIRGNQPASSAYKQALTEIPNAAEYRPSGWRRLASMIAGGAMGATGNAALGVQSARTINEYPYQTALEQYQTKLGGLQSAAELERSDVESQIGALEKAYSYGLDYNKYLETKAHNEAMEQTAQQRAETADKVASNPDYEFIQMPDGVKAVDKKGIQKPFFIPGETIGGMNARSQRMQAVTGQGQLAVAQRNAAVNEGQLGVAQQRADIYQEATDISGRQADIAAAAQRTNAFRTSEQVTDWRERRRLAERGLELRVSPARTQGIDDALSEMSIDPSFSEYIEWDDNIGAYKVSDDVDQFEYDRVMDEADERYERAKSGRVPRRAPAPGGQRAPSIAPSIETNPNPLIKVPPGGFDRGRDYLGGVD
jgi:hypothetical protein